MPVPVFFDCHFVEQLCSGGKISAQRIGKIAVNAAVLLFCRDGQSQELRLCKVAKFHAQFPVQYVEMAKSRKEMTAPMENWNAVELDCKRNCLLGCDKISLLGENPKKN